MKCEREAITTERNNVPRYDKEARKRHSEARERWNEAKRDRREYCMCKELFLTSTLELIPHWQSVNVTFYG